MPTCQPPASGQVEGTGRQCTGLWSTCRQMPTAQADTVFTVHLPCWTMCLPSDHSFLLLTQSMPGTLLGPKQGSKD